MTSAQAAWAALTALFLVAAITLRLVDDATVGYSIVCLAVSIVGWVALAAMIVSDRR